ncbi:uncharacterized protein V6R79_003487 [Siganus canaliculatus]
MGRKSSSGKEDKKMRGDVPPQEDSNGCSACCRLCDRKCSNVCRFPLLVALLQLLLGVAVTVVAFLTLAVSPSLLARETPHWAGIILILVSILGLILYCISFFTDETSFLRFIVKLLYFILCTIGLFISVLVMAFALHHYLQTSNLSCETMAEKCVCKLDADDPLARTFAYEGVTDCTVITEELATFFLVQIVLNLVQAVVCAIGAFIIWRNRYQVFFAGLQIGSPSSQQWQKV